MSNQKLSPEKYILTKARLLPVYKCFVTKDWKTAGMSNVLVMRRHVNGNCTAGIYLVDLFCLGIKDSAYFFNEPEAAIIEKTVGADDSLEEINYNLAHNIIYAGHDFAIEFDIKPHKSFAITKYILEEDNDEIPIVEIHTGDKKGMPHLLVNEQYNYGPVLQKLKKHAGEGNYTFTLIDESDYADETDFDDDNWDGEEEAEEAWLDDIIPGMIDFNNIKNFFDDELFNALDENSRSIPEELIITSELLWRRLAKAKPLAIIPEKSILENDIYKAYEHKRELWHIDYETKKAGQEKAYDELILLAQDAGISEYLALLDKYRDNEYAQVMIFHGTPFLTLMNEFEYLENNFSQYSPAMQLTIAAYGVLIQKNMERYHFILHAENVEQAYPQNNTIHALHHKGFWLVKVLRSLQLKITKEILLYHALIRIGGTGGAIKFLYAAQLNAWLLEYMNIDEDAIFNTEDEFPFL